MSGSTSDISRVKGAVQVREMVESCIVAVREPTAERTPKVKDQTVHPSDYIGS